LLIEESRTNICLQSENFGTTWNNDSGAVTITTDVEVSPGGLTTADKIAESASTTVRRICIQTISVTSGTTYSYSCYIKAGERDFAQMATGTGLSGAFQNFIVNGANAGTLGSSSGIVSSRIDAMPNGWYRCAIVVTATATGNTQVTVGPASTSTITRWQAYSSTAGSGIYAWGAQLEAGAFPTSYIPTTTASVVRSADVCSITGGDFTSFYNQSEGAFLLKATSLMATATTGNRTFVSFTDGGYINQQALYKNVNGTNLSYAIGSGVGHAIGTLTAGSPFAVSGAMQVANNAAAFNGAAAVAVTGSATTGISKLEFRDPTGAAAGHPTMHISQFRYYKKRLPNAKLQAITA
jgi:hypothetical protein